MKIGFFTDTYLPNVDGVVRSILNFRKGLEAQGHDVFVFSSGTAEDARGNKDPRVVFHRGVKFPPYPQYKVALFPYLKSQEAARRFGIQLVHSHGIATMGAAAIYTSKMAGLPLVGTFHTLIPKSLTIVTSSKWGQDAAEGVAWKAIGLFYEPFDLVTAPSKVICRMMADNGIEGVVPVPNGIDISAYSVPKDRNALRKKLGIKQGEKVVLVAGRMSAEKNVDVVLRAFKLLQKEEKGARLVVSGDGPARKGIEALAKELGIAKSVDFKGILPEGLFASYYAAADAFVTASTFETQGLTIVESMACGTPVVGADSMAIPETIRHGKNGFLFKPGDEADCAEKVEKLLNLSATARAAMSREARKTAEGYSIGACTKRLVGFYRKVLQAR